VRLAGRRRRRIWLAGAQGSHHPKSAQASFGPPDVATAQQRTGIILRHRFDDRRLRIFP
jgi:hypothetical protein